MKNSEEYIIAKKSNSSFLYSFRLIPKDKNNAIHTIYAFCRQTDDIVDNEKDSPEIKYEKIHRWRSEFEKCLRGESEYPLLNNVNKVIKKYKIPVEPFFELIKGVEQDLQTSRYKDFESLYQYCYRVAVTVGLMSIEVFGYKSADAKQYAINLGIAFQLTNILRDIKTDALNDRIYIPEEDLIKYGYNEEDLLNSRYNHSFIELMKFECQRAKEYFERANNCYNPKDNNLLYPARIMQKIYFNLLNKIEKVNYNVFARKVKISKLKKIYFALGEYMKCKFV